MKGDESMEIWKEIKGYEGLYEVSNLGNVRSIDRIVPPGKKLKGIERKQYLNKKNGYLYVNLSRNGKGKTCPVHRLVGEAFIEKAEGKNTINHINENKLDNRATNLEWLSLMENLKFGTHYERAKKNHAVIRGKDHSGYGKFGANARTHKGRVIGVNTKDPNDVVEFPTAVDACRALGMSTGHLCDVLKGNGKSCGGYIWRRESV